MARYPRISPSPRISHSRRVSHSRSIDSLRIKTAAHFTVLLLLAGCTQYKAATTENFTRSLNNYYALHDECLYPDPVRFPYEVSTREEPAKLTKGLDALTAAGLLNREEEGSIQVKRYSPTTFGSRVNSRFCYGHRVVTSIDSFTPPATVNGQSVSRVDYHYKLMDVPGWAQSDQMKKAFPGLAKSTADAPQATDTLVLTVNGWQVPE